MTLGLTLFALGASVVASRSPSDQSVGQPIATDRHAGVILMRHAKAPGRGEPANFDLNDCTTQRNLSDKGRAEALDLGAALREQDLGIVKVLASRWCRARETAQLLNDGLVEPSAEFDNLDFNKHRATSLIERELQLIESWRGLGRLLIVTHSSNLQRITGLDVLPGTLIVAKPKSERDASIVFEMLPAHKGRS
jgi:phosphohistidine phosphatase SixA